MDITRYIGLYLLKNHFCYVHGIGNIELVKRPSVYDGKTLMPPSYEVVVTPGGSIDDNLANFIAVNEQISISKAANALRDFSGEARKQMAAGNEVAIPNIGCLTEQNGKVKFITDNNFHFTPAGIPTIRNSKQLDEQNSRLAHKPSYPPPSKADSVNWSMVILVIVLIIIVAGGIYGIYYYSASNKSAQAPPVVKDTVIQAPLPLPDTAKPPPIDTAALTAAMEGDTMMVNTYRMIIGNYPTKEKAERRIFNLRKGGNIVDMVQLDSANYLVISTISCRPVDTAHIMDSLEAMFGYKQVATYK